MRWEKALDVLESFLKRGQELQGGRAALGEEGLDRGGLWIPVGTAHEADWTQDEFLWGG